MTHHSRLAVVVASLLTVLALAPHEGWARKGPKYGVFGVVNGKRFKATSVGAEDPCAIGIYEPGPGGPGSVVFTAIECRGKRRRQGAAVKRNFKQVVITCSKFDWKLDTNAFPWEIPCGAGSVYAENRTGRFGAVLSTTMWGGSYDFSVNPPLGSLRMRIDGVDGNVVRGVVSGIFDTVLQGSSGGGASIEGELQFSFPFRVQ